MTSNTINEDAQLLRQGEIVLTNLLYWLGTLLVSAIFYLLTIRGFILSADLCAMSLIALTLSGFWFIHLMFYWTSSPDERDAMRWRTTALTFLQRKFPIVAVIYMVITIAIIAARPHS